MKREYEGGESSGSGKAKVIEAEEDEHLAALGYKVRPSDMPDIVHKLEQLDKALASGPGGGVSHLFSETVHYDPSDLANWLESMLVEINGGPPPPTDPFDAFSSAGSSSVDFPTRIYDSDASLSAIPGEIVLREGTSSSSSSSGNKKTKTEAAGGKGRVESATPFVLMDSQETGIRLVHTLMACAEAVQEQNTKAAEGLVNQIGVLASSQAGAMRKVAAFFAEALARRIFPQPPAPPLNPVPSEDLDLHFYESCPYLKFAHFTANQAILETFSGRSRVHVIDFNLKQGMQWPALIQALALRPEGPPELRMTGIVLPSQDGGDSLQDVGRKLSQLAETIHVRFHFTAIVAASLSGLEEQMIAMQRPEDDAAEAVAVNSIFVLHRLLACSGAIERVLASIRRLRPAIVTVVEQEAEHNGPIFLDRFTEALHYYSTMFDSLEGTEGQDHTLSEMYLGKEICNVVACEGEERVERHESLSRWRARMSGAGFEPVHLGSNAFKQASMLLALFGGGDGYRVEERDGCLTLGWYTRPLISTSAWRVVRHCQVR